MSIVISWAGVGVCIAILTHAAFTIWYAASFKVSIVSKIDNLVLALERFDKELEKRDAQISAVWKKLDLMNDRLTKVEK